MKNPELNQKLIELRDMILAGVDGIIFNMASWGNVEYNGEVLRENICGTAGCIAGTYIMKDMSFHERISWVTKEPVNDIVNEFAAKLNCDRSFAYRISNPSSRDIDAARLYHDWGYWSQRDAVQWLQYWIDLQ